MGKKYFAFMVGTLGSSCCSLIDPDSRYSRGEATRAYDNVALHVSSPHTFPHSENEANAALGASACGIGSAAALFVDPS